MNLIDCRCFINQSQGSSHRADRLDLLALGFYQPVFTSALFNGTLRTLNAKASRRTNVVFLSSVGADLPHWIWEASCSHSIKSERSDA